MFVNENFNLSSFRILNFTGTQTGTLSQIPHCDSSCLPKIPSWFLIISRKTLTITR